MSAYLLEREEAERRSLRARINTFERRHPLLFAYALVITLDAALIAAFFVMGALK